MSNKNLTDNRKNIPSITGVFLYIDDDEVTWRYWQEINSAAVQQSISLRHGRISANAASQIIPSMLRKDVTSWLVLHRAGNFEELLVVPYPNNTLREKLSTLGSNEGHPQRLLEVIRGDKNRNWYPGAGYRNLADRHMVSLHVDLFQLIRIPQSLYQILDSEPAEDGEVQQSFRQVSIEVSHRRGEILSRLVEANDLETAKVIADELDNLLITANQSLFEKVASQQQNLPDLPIIDEFSDVLDSESIKFLTSYNTVKEFAYKNHLNHFDFSLPASGLWKTLELELNVSLIWFLRILYNVTGKDSPWSPIQPEDFKAIINTGGGNSINLNKRESSSRLKGVMFGPIQHMLEVSHKNGVSEKIRTLPIQFAHIKNVHDFLLEQSGQDNLSWLIEEVTTFRNRHAHVASMRQKDFEALEALLLSPHNNASLSHLGRVCLMKREVLAFAR